MDSRAIGRRTLRRIATLLILAAMLVALPIAAGADVVLTFEDPGSQIFQQSLDHPCIFGDPSCNNPAGFNFTLLPVHADGSYASPVYTVGQIAALVGNAFIVGLDINQSTQNVPPYTITEFRLVINGVTQFHLPGTNVTTLVNNGNGFSDALIRGFDLSGFTSDMSAQFFLTYSNDTGGREEFFLQPAAVVAEPSTLLLLGSGLIGLGAWKRKWMRLT